MIQKLLGLARTSGLAAVLLATTACSFYAPAYSPSFQNVQQMSNLKNPISIGTFSVDKPELNTISLRGNSMASANGSYGVYLRDAVTSELKAAEKLSVAPGVPVLSARIMKNEIDASGISRGEGMIAAKFTLMRNDKPVYEKQLSAQDSFPSSFMGAIAIPNAAKSYPTLVEKLINALFSDEDFTKAANN